jgi:2-polyprenyl-3-methyl-5-hydroxy-6-metoxy-1,4-benzoquinol methylase
MTARKLTGKVEEVPTAKADAESDAGLELLQRFEADLRSLKSPALTGAEIKAQFALARWYHCKATEGGRRYQLRLSVQDKAICSRFFKELGIGRAECLEKIYTTNVSSPPAPRANLAIVASVTEKEPDPLPPPPQPEEVEPPRKHPKTDHGERRFDKTQLRESDKGPSVHRDYAAHWFRWGYAHRFHKNDLRSLEVGCGQDQPLIKVLSKHTASVPAIHVAVDLNKIQKKSNMGWVRTHDEFNFVDDWELLAEEYGAATFDIVTCFEVIEHMETTDGRKLLAGIHGLLKKGGTVLLSTPVYNEKHMAANHLHEYRYNELEGFFKAADFKVVKVHGTFMTSQAMKRVMTDEERALVDRLNEFYSWDVLANFLAPKYPQAASNCCWVLTK